MYRLIKSAVTLSPTVLAKYPSSQNSPPHNSFFTSGNFSNTLCRRDTLQYAYHMRYRISRWKTQEDMNVIRSYTNLLNLKLILLRNFPKNLLNLLPYILPLNPFSIFRRPHQMIFCIVNRMSSPSDCHGVSYTTFHLPLADAPFNKKAEIENTDPQEDL